MNAPRRPHYTFGIGNAKFLLSAKQGESSKKGEKKNVNTKPKNTKPTCYHYRKPSHTKNTCRSKIGK